MFLCGFGKYLFIVVVVFLRSLLLFHYFGHDMVMMSSVQIAIFFCKIGPIRADQVYCIVSNDNYWDSPSPEVFLLLCVCVLQKLHSLPGLSNCLLQSKVHFN